MLLAVAVSQSIFSALIISDANDFIDVGKKNFPVTDFPGASGRRNCLNDFFDHGVGDDQLELDLGNKIDGIFPSAVKLSVSLLSAMAASLEYGHAFDANLVQRILYAFQLGHLDDCFDFGHRDSYQSYAKISEAELLILVLLQDRGLKFHRTR
jgi:hypothetical protein